jgi:hypothetical protein
MLPNYDASISFLKRFHPGRRWVLTGINPDRTAKPATVTATFDDGRIDACRTWLEDKGRVFNLYFSVGEINKDLSSKADRIDIARVVYLHVDLDPRAGEDIASEQKRILTLLQKNDKLPQPTAITFSGGGYQGFWAIETPIEIGGKLEKAEDAKLHNLFIEHTLGADHCHNIDRIMRLPGSVNRPDEKKRAKGRTEALAEVIDFQDVKYGLDRFPKASVAKPADKTSDPTAPTKAAPSNVTRLKSIEDLPETVSKRLKIVICQGTDPDEPRKFPSRSEWLFYVTCGLVKAGVKDDVIFSVLTDPQFSISSSVIDKGNRAEKYAMRQIERAKEESDHPWLRKMNERFSVIESMNGKCRIVEEQWDEGIKRSHLVKQSFEDFQNRYMNIQVDLGFNDEGKPIQKPLGLWWLRQQHRRQYGKLVFVPGVDVPDAYNLWRGFGVDPKPGKCELFLNHVRNVICNGIEEHYNYFVGWMANGVQCPSRPGYAAVVMKGDQGTGKSFVAKAYGSLFGRHFMQVTDPKHLVGSFNAHLRDCVVLFGDEAFFAGDKKHESILKMLITEEMLMVEPKGVDAEQSCNCIHLMMASNDHWVVPAGVGDRRFFVLQVNNNHKEDHNYFIAIQKELDNGGREALLHYLMNYDLKNFDVRVIPKTNELQKQKLYSLAAEEMWWREKLGEGRLLPEHGQWQREVAFGDLYYDYIIHCRTTSTAYRKATKNSLKIMLRKYLPEDGLIEYNADATVEVTQMDGSKKIIERPLFLRFPSLDECRKCWQTCFGGATDWAKEVPPVSQNNLYGNI